MGEYADRWCRPNSDSLPLELPCREAPDVDVVLVESAAAVLLKLDFEFVLMLRYWQPADGTRRADARPSPRAGRCSAWEFS
jgi:hypothetical protein